MTSTEDTPLTPIDAQSREIAWQSQCIATLQQQELLLRAEVQSLNEDRTQIKAKLAARVTAHDADGKALIKLGAAHDALLAAVRKHRDQRGDDRCWMDDDALYAALPEGKDGADTRLPPPETMLACCQRYIAHRHDPSQPYVSPQREVEMMTEALAQLRTDLATVQTKSTQLIDATGRTVVSLATALKPLAALGEVYYEEEPDSDVLVHSLRLRDDVEYEAKLTVGDCRAAAALLRKVTP